MEGILHAGSKSGDVAALLALYRATSGPCWKNSWDSNMNVSTWHGVTTNSEGRVVSLSLLGNNLQGPIPRELGKLGALKTLLLRRNQLSGPIPPELGNLRELKSLWLYVNQLTGTIPAAIGQLSKLETLDLSFNKLDGPIPRELGKLGALKTLSLWGNQLSGPIPPELGNLAALTYLNLQRNQLSGPVPPELGDLGALRKLYLPANQLSGPIPRELGRLGALKELVLWGNHLSGTIPAAIGQLSKLETLGLSSNKLDGTIPKELGKLRALTSLYLNDNSFTALGRAGDALTLVNSTGSGLHLENNPWIMPPEAVAEEGLPAVKNYLLDVQKAGEEVRSLQLLKVVLVGSSAAGKTSLMNSIVSGRGSRTVGTSKEVSTVGIDLLRHRLKGSTVEFYDCAGQVDYAGMQQTFLTRRALYLLVWDVNNVNICHGRSDLDQAIDRIIMQWLYSLLLRAPGSTVMLVANKCDGSISEFTETAERVETRVRELLEDWQNGRGIRSQVTRRVTDVTLLPEPSRVSCLDGCPQALGLTALIERISAQVATPILVPPAWDLALKVIDALRDGLDPLRAAQQHLKIAMGGGGGLVGSKFITNAELSLTWKGIVESVRGEVQATGQQTVVSNTESALVGALWISEFAGQILRVGGGDGIFLDVVWLSTGLKPILSHRLRDERFPSEQLSALRDELVDDGVLREAFARHLWGGILGGLGAESAEELVVAALFRVLLKLGVVLPLGQMVLRADDGRASHASRVGGGPRDMLVIMRLPETCTEEQQGKLDDLAGEARPGFREVTFKWRFDGAGPPHGLVERLIALCHVIGDVERGLCWRYGAVFKSCFPAPDHGTGRLYTVVIRYDHHDRVLAVRMFGPLENSRVWAAVRFVTSAMIQLSKDWPGVMWEGYPECAKHPGERMYLASPAEARIGSVLLPAADPGLRRRRCDCSLDAAGVLGLVLKRLGNVIDTREGDPFQGLPDVDPEPACACCSEAFNIWLPYAGKTAMGLVTSALILFGAAAALVETEETLWKLCLGFVVLLLLGAVVAAFCACRYKILSARETLRHNDGQEDDPGRDV